MVEREQIEVDIQSICAIIAGAQARRGLNGEWSLTISLNGDVRLGDGRILPIRRDVSIKARQSGRKPNPANNWGKGGGFQKRKTPDSRQN